MSRVPIVPRPLRPGSMVRVVAPADSRVSVRNEANEAVAAGRFKELGLRISFGEHVDEMDRFESSSVESRLADLHAAFADDQVDGILTVIGGYSSHELLPGLDFELIAAHPKVLCGYSDITALQNAIWARTGMVTWSGPHWSSFGMRDLFDPTQDWFTQALMDDQPIDVRPSPWHTDDAWFADQDDRPRYPSEWWELQPGTAAGTIVGGNLCTLNLLHGTQWMPDLAGTVLFVEDDYLSDPATFRRDLVSLLRQPGADEVQGLVIGRFQRRSGVTREHLDEIVASIPQLRGLPVLANAEFGHTNPMITFPIGGHVELQVGDGSRLQVITSQPG